VEGPREEVARLAEVLEAAAIDLDRRVIAQKELVEALAVFAAVTTAVTAIEAEEEAVPSLPPVPGSTVPPWRDGLLVTALAPSYQRILGGVAHTRHGHVPRRVLMVSGSDRLRLLVVISQMPRYSLFCLFRRVAQP